MILGKAAVLLFSGLSAAAAAKVKLRPLLRGQKDAAKAGGTRRPRGGYGPAVGAGAGTDRQVGLLHMLQGRPMLAAAVVDGDKEHAGVPKRTEAAVAEEDEDGTRSRVGNAFATALPKAEIEAETPQVTEANGLVSILPFTEIGQGTCRDGAGNSYDRVWVSSHSQCDGHQHETPEECAAYCWNLPTEGAPPLLGFQLWDMGNCDCIYDKEFEVCSDENEHCAYWAHHGECENNEPYMSMFCQLACNNCPPACSDESEHCVGWANLGYCEDTYEEYMATNCPLACDLCGSFLGDACRDGYSFGETGAGPIESYNSADTSGVACYSFQYRGIGQACASSLECSSGHCINGICYASDKCQPLKHIEGSTFDAEQVLLLFVGSGFDDQDTWTREVNRIFGELSNQNMFARTTEQFTALYSTELEPSFCELDCNGIGQLLCCSTTIARTASRYCNPFGTAFHANVQTVVVHNSDAYGGAGYTTENVATITIHGSAPMVALHELGHSLFDLADEYPSGQGTTYDPNCDTSDCSKWSDLLLNDNSLTRELAEGVAEVYGTVECLPGQCQNGAYYTGHRSFMLSLGHDLGAVNERFTCCTYLALTKSMPTYCEVFDSPTGYLLNYCRDNDYQGYGTTSYISAPPPGEADEEGGGNFISVGGATLITINTVDDTWTSTPAGRGVFPRAKVVGDGLPQDEGEADQSEVYRVKVTFARKGRGESNSASSHSKHKSSESPSAAKKKGGEPKSRLVATKERVYFLKIDEDVDVPPHEPHVSDGDGDVSIKIDVRPPGNGNKGGKRGGDRVRVSRAILDLVLDIPNNVEVVSVETKKMPVMKILEEGHNGSGGDSKIF